MSCGIKSKLTLYSFYLSSASWRIRAVLALKKLPFVYETVHLLNGEQHSDEYVNKINPMHQSPAMQVIDAAGNAHMLTQSLAIIQYLEEMYPNTESVLPADPIARAHTRAIADTISGGIQPLQNLETLTKYRAPFGEPDLDAEQRKEIGAFWIRRKLEHLELLVARTAGKYCVGDQVTLADVCLVPQMFNARRFEVDLAPFPVLRQIDERLGELDMFKVSHPYECPDAPKSD